MERHGKRSTGGRRKRGIALVLVMASMALLALLSVAFLSLSQTEDRASISFSNAVDVRTLSDLPVDLVIGQIRKAAENNGITRTWASQPGLLRVFGTRDDGSGVRSKVEAAYKLYSDDTLVWVDGSGEALATELAGDRVELDDWDGKPGMFTDINEPVRVKVDSEATGSYLEYPVVDPRAYATGRSNPVAGFSYGTDAERKNREVPGGGVSESGLPMPVRWIYVLEDGSMVSPDSADEVEAVFGGAGAPTRENPVVGRIAFWTDDESCKVNINTASEGVFWDTPRANNETDNSYARRIPATDEFSRYLGHPALTSLSPVFQAFGRDFEITDELSDADRALRLERYYRLSPYVNWGGSLGGTVTATSAVSQKRNRLYASVDEMFFDPERARNDALLDRDDFHLGKFFLTAHSRAPELNLFNKPRISLWPVSESSADRNAKDKLFAFCATVGGRTRYWMFQRRQNYKSHSLPGSSQSPTQDYGISRNQAMLHSYLHPLTSHPVPGFAGGSFNTKYGRGKREQIIASSFDLVRWGVNSYSTGMDPKYAYLPARGGIGGTSNPGLLGETSAVPFDWKRSTSAHVGRGFGRWPTITEAAINFVASEDDGSGKASKMRAFLMLEPFSPTVGPPSWSANVIYRISGLDGFRIDRGTGAEGLGFPSGGTLADNETDFATGWVGGGHSTAATGFHPMFAQAKRSGSGDWRAKAAGPGDRKTHYNWVTPEIEVSGTDEFAFRGGSFKVEIYTAWPDAANRVLVQTVNMVLPDCRLKVPRVGAGIAPLDTRFAAQGAAMRDWLVRDGDITRSVEARAAGPAKGDLRFIAALNEVPSFYFGVHPKYEDTTVERLHFIRNSAHTHDGQYGPPSPELGSGNGNRYASTWNTGGTLVSGVSYFRECWPMVPRGLAGAFNKANQPGDWDTGVGRTEDGPYINKPDEGNISTGGDGGYFSRGSFNVEDGRSFTPNRQICSAVAFGSLPTGIDPTAAATEADHLAKMEPWQTLLFCPNPASRSTPALSEPRAADHRGFQGPRDHLYLDLFWMPVVEPYAISEPISTGGKIQMNYRIVPFDYIERSTGIHAALKSTKVMAITAESAGGGTSGGGTSYKEGTVHPKELRYAVDAGKTLQGFTDRFDRGDVFRSATEICEIFLVPKRIPGRSYASDAKDPSGFSYDRMVEWWNGALGAVDGFELTGDNARESPYNQLYPRLTTKSNVYRVHYRVQMLKKARSTEPGRWVEGRDLVTAENRGSALLERYLDPNDNELDAVMVGGGATFTQTWDDYFRFRIIQRQRFAP